MSFEPYCGGGGTFIIYYAKVLNALRNVIVTERHGTALQALPGRKNEAQPSASQKGN